MTREQMVRAFNEWMRRFIEEPERFEREFQTVTEYMAETADGKEPSYGEVCAAYMLSMFGEVGGPQDVPAPAARPDAA